MRCTAYPLFVLGCLATAAGCGGSGSDSTTGTRELARTAVHLSLDGDAFSALVNQAIGSTFGAARNRIEGSGRRLSVEQTQQLETAIRGVFLEVYPQTAWEEALVPLYLNGFDRSELQEIIRFQQTALGRKLAVVQAQLATGGGGLGQQLIESRQAEFSRRLAEQLTSAWGAAAVRP